MSFAGAGGVDLGTAYGRIGVEFADDMIQQQLRRLDTSIADSIKGIGKKFQGIGTEIALGLAPISAFMGKGLLSFMDFDSVLTEIEARTGATADQMALVQKTALQMGQATAFSASEAAQAMLELLSSGYSLDEAFTALKPVLDAAAAGNMGLGETADAVTDILAQFRLGAEDAAMVADQLARSAQASSATMPEMAQGFANVGNIANEFGLSVEETAAILAQFAENGIKGAEAGTLLKSMLTNTTRTTEDAQGMWKKLGISMFDARGQIRPLNDVMVELSAKMDTLTDQERIEAIQALAGSYGQAGLSAMMASDGFGDMVQKMREQKSAAEVAQKMMQSLRGVVEQLASSVDTFSILILKPAIEKYIKPLIPNLTALVNKFSEWAEKNPDLAAKLGLVLSILAVLGPAIFGLGTAFTLVGTIIGLIISPLGLMVGLFAALGIASKKNLFGIGTFLKDIKTKLGGFFKELSDAWDRAKAFAEMRPGEGGLLETLKIFFTTFEGASTFLEGALQKLGFSAMAARQVAKAINEIAQAGFRIFEAFQTGGLGGLFEQLIAEITNKAESIKQAITTVWDSVKAAAPEIGKNLGEMTGQALHWMISKIIEYGPLVIGGLLAMLYWVITTGYPEFLKFATLLASGFIMGFIEGFDADQLLAELLLMLNGIIAVGTPWARELLGKILAEVQGVLAAAAESARLILTLIAFYVFQKLNDAAISARMLLQLLAYYVFEKLNEASTTAKTLITLIEYYIVDTLQRASNTASTILEGLYIILKNTWDRAVLSARMLWAIFLYHLLELSNGIRERLNNVKQFFSDLSDFVTAIFNYLVGKVFGFAASMLLAATNLLNTAQNIGTNIVNGIRNGIDAAWEGLKSHFSGLVGELEGVANWVLGNNSPSKVFADRVGKWIPAGIAVGINNGMQTALDALTNMTGQLVSLAPTPGMTPVVAGAAGFAGNTTNNSQQTVIQGGVNITVQTQPGQSSEEIATVVQDRFMRELQRRGGGTVRA